MEVVEHMLWAAVVKGGEVVDSRASVAGEALEELEVSLSPNEKPLRQIPRKSQLEVGVCL